MNFRKKINPLVLFRSAPASLGGRDHQFVIRRPVGDAVEVHAAALRSITGRPDLTDLADGIKAILPERRYHTNSPSRWCYWCSQAGRAGKTSPVGRCPTTPPATVVAAEMSRRRRGRGPRGRPPKYYRPAPPDWLGRQNKSNPDGKVVLQMLQRWLGRQNKSNPDGKVVLQMLQRWLGRQNKSNPDGKVVLQTLQRWLGHRNKSASDGKVALQGASAPAPPCKRPRWSRPPKRCGLRRPAKRVRGGCAGRRIRWVQGSALARC